MKARLLLLVVGTAGILTGCTGLNSDRYLLNKQTFMLNQGNPPTYVEGYIDGCSAGRRLGGDKHFVYRKNNTRFEKDALYARGWQEGQINCRNEALEEEQLGLKKPRVDRTEDIHTREEIRPSDAEKAEMQEIWEQLKK